MMLFFKGGNRKWWCLSAFSHWFTLKFTLMAAVVGISFYLWMINTFSSPLDAVPPPVFIIFFSRKVLFYTVTALKSPFQSVSYVTTISTDYISQIICHFVFQLSQWAFQSSNQLLRFQLTHCTAYPPYYSLLIFTHPNITLFFSLSSFTLSLILSSLNLQHKNKVVELPRIHYYPMVHYSVVCNFFSV